MAEPRPPQPPQPPQPSQPSQPPRPLEGHGVLVTGGAGDLGRALARRFAAAGARVALLDVDAEALTAAQSALADAGDAGLEAFGIRCDLTDPDQTAAAVAEAARALGRLDVLVNNAGVGQRSAFAATRPEVFRRVMEVNWLGSVHATLAALPHLKARRGRIVTISSVAGLAPLLGRSAYVASKHALHGLFDTLRAEVADDGVSVTLVCPSFIESRFEVRSLGGDGRPVGRPRSKVGRLATPDAVADAVVRAAVRRRRRVVLSPVGRLTDLLQRLWPPAYAALMRRLLRTEIAPR